MDYVYDIEFYQNFFCVNFRSFPDGEEKITFEISQRKDQRKELLMFLKQDGLRLIGFNNVGYDYPVLHMLIESPEISLLIWWKKIQRSIFSGKEKRFMVWESQRHVFQIDLFKINHYDNLARSTSLKWLEFTKRWSKVQDLPIKPDKVLQEHEMTDIIRYCWNDVDFTFELAEDCWNAVKFRENMSEVLGRNVMDYSDVKLGEYLNQKKYEELSGRNWKEFREERTFRKNYRMKDIIPDVIEFKTPVMQKWLAELKERSFIDDKRDKFRYDIIIGEDGFEEVRRRDYPITDSQIDKDLKPSLLALKTIVTFAKGGLHTVELPRVVTKKEGWQFMEKDVASMYPRGIVVDGIYPKHLGKNWNEGIANAYDYRNNVLKPKMKELEYGSKEYRKVDDEQAVYKLAMNGGGFGKLGSAYSWQFDPLAKYQVTMGCELKLLMLIEQFVIHGIKIVSVNTDGVVIHYPKSKESTVLGICKWWEELTQFVLEDTHYSKIVFSSVNHYIAVICDPVTGEKIKVKYKGDYEIDKEPHKNNSQRIVTIALSEYFVNDIPIKDIIGKLGYRFDNNGKEEQVSIYDYCIGKKKTSSCEYWLVNKGKAKLLKDKVIRYYVSKIPNQLLKKYTKGKQEGSFEKVNAGFDITLFMDFFTPESVGGVYKIDNNYYIGECKKIIDPILSGTRMTEGGAHVQTKLF
jgi:hypothetical protein